MDLGLDYSDSVEYFWPLVLFQVGFCTPKSAWPVGVIGVSRQALSGFYKTKREPSSRGSSFFYRIAISVRARPQLWDPVFSPSGAFG